MLKTAKKRTTCLIIALATFLATAGAIPRGEAEEASFTTIDVPGASSVGQLNGSVALSINSAGSIVGRFVSAADNNTHGFFRNWRGDFTIIDFPGAVFTVAAGINSRGDIVGMYRLRGEARTVRHGYLLSRGHFTTIEPLGAIFTNALGINSHGDIVGRYCSVAPCVAGAGHFHGFLLRKGQMTTLDVPDGIETHAWKITNAGVILGGYKGRDGKFHIFTLNEDELTTIDYPGAYETGPAGDNGGINARGDVVGSYCDTELCGNEHGFLRSAEGEFAPIDFPGAASTIAFGVNQHYEIVGYYVDSAHKAHGFLLNARERREEGAERDQAK